jgi:hypothetical protein
MSQVPIAPNLDILTETVTDTRAAPPSATAQMQRIFEELNDAAAQSALIIGAAGRSSPVERPATAKKKGKSKSSDAASSWTPVSVALIAGIVSVGIEVLSREAIWSKFNLPPLKHWYAFVPRAVIQFLARLIGPQIILWSGPVLYPLLAIVISYTVAKAAGLGKKKIKAIFRLAGFEWDRDAFCCGWLISGATGSGKTVSSIVTKFHQVFQRESGVLRDSWIGSDLELKVVGIEVGYQRETEPIYAKLLTLRDNRRELDAAIESALQRTLIGDIAYESMSVEQRVQHAEAMKVEIQAKINEKIDGLRNQKAVLLEQRSQLSIEGGEEGLEENLASYQSAIQELDRDIVAAQTPSLIGRDATSVAAIEYRTLQNKAAQIEAEIGRIEWQELQPIKQRFDDLMKKIEQAKYRAFPWGGLCIDEKGLFWQTLSPMARHYKRAHHLMLLQTRPDWAPPEWKPSARFNLLSDPKIKPSAYAKAIVDTAASVAGGSDDKGFFKTSAQKWIEASIDLQWGVREFQIANGLAIKNAILPSLKRCLSILTSIDTYRDWLMEENVLQPEKPSKQPAAAGAPSAAAAKKLAGLVPDDPRFLSALPERLRKTLIDFRKYWSQPPDQLGGVVGTIDNYLTYFSGDDVAEVFCADNTFDIKDIDRGMILLVAMPQKLQTERRYVCTLLKLLFYQHVLSRFDLRHDADRWENKNVLICWQDEAQRFVTEADGNVDVIRQALGTTVMATQSLLSLFPPLGGKEKAEVILLNLRNREIFRVADEESARITADFIGKHEIKRQDRSVSGQGTTINYRTEEQHKIKPTVLRSLPKHSAIVCHSDGHFRKVLIPPRDNEGRIAEWWLRGDAPALYKIMVRLGLVK